MPPDRVVESQPEATGGGVVDFLATGLGDRSYLVAAGGAAVMVDPQRDVEPFLQAAENLGVRLTHVLETHVHNDYVSGGLELARRSGATLVLPEGSGAGFAHRPVRDGDVLESGGLRVRALRTPGHTPEHTSYVVERDGARPLLFSGGSLLSGGAGRTDLLGAAWTDRLTAEQFVSVRRLASLAGETLVRPTHGAGSFCTAAAPVRDGFTTIAEERIGNPALADDDPLAFARRQLAGLMRHPAYYSQMAPINRAGARPLGRLVAPPPLVPADVAAMQAAGIAVVDARPRTSFAAAHIPGSLNIELDDAFGSYVGWLLPFDSPLAIVLEHDADGLEAVGQLAAIGFEHVRGAIVGVDRWTSDGRPIARLERVDLAQARRTLTSPHPPLLLDVRQPAEWAEGVLPGSVLRFVADLADPDAWLPRGRPVWTICRSGHRAAMAASMLAAAGYAAAAVDGGGVGDLLHS